MGVGVGVGCGGGGGIPSDYLVSTPILVVLLFGLWFLLNCDMKAITHICYNNNLKTEVNV